MDTAYSTSIIQISKQYSIANIWATGNFFLPGTLSNNVQPGNKPISANLLDRSKLRSTHMCDPDIADIIDKAKNAHIVPGFAQASLI